MSIDFQEPKKARYGVEPTVLQTKLQAIDMKISEKSSALDKPEVFANARAMSRHELDLERSLTHDRDGLELSKCLVKPKSPDPEYLDRAHPIYHLDSILEEALEKRKAGTSEVKCEDTKFVPDTEQADIQAPIPEEDKTDIGCHLDRTVSPTTDCVDDIAAASGSEKSGIKQSEKRKRVTSTPYVMKGQGANAGRVTDMADVDCGDSCKTVDLPVESIPSDVIERYRLTVDQIRDLPRFHNYQPGEPSKVGFSS